ncbi:sigma-70 family RNA polymerase sigma factor [Alsobacter sp. KACC 23698]|uniref:RNA polymerase sigma factor n=1 Tax=Alsobacter sp. KACC 23698 TaxID=3149229 RepID=A0AAU7JJE2_9HYPH
MSAADVACSSPAFAPRGAAGLPRSPSALGTSAALIHRAVQGVGAMARRFAGVLQARTAPASSSPDFETEALPHLDAVYNLARYLCRDPDRAEDIVQEAYLRAFRGWSEFRGGSVRAWLFAIVRHCHLSLRERDRRGAAPVASRSPGEGDDGEDDPVLGLPAEGDPELALLRKDEDALVRRILDVLPDDAREILVLRDIEDCSYREIADVLGVPIGTVMSRISRARRAFARRWATIMQGAAR